MRCVSKIKVIFNYSFYPKYNGSTDVGIYCFFRDSKNNTSPKVDLISRNVISTVTFYSIKSISYGSSNLLKSKKFKMRLEKAVTDSLQ